MKVRFFRVVWVLCVLMTLGFLSLLTYGTTETAKLAGAVFLAFPAVIGFIVVYIFMGSFGWPQAPEPYNPFQRLN